ASNRRIGSGAARLVQPSSAGFPACGSRDILVLCPGWNLVTRKSPEPEDKNVCATTQTRLPACYTTGESRNLSYEQTFPRPFLRHREPVRRFPSALSRGALRFPRGPRATRFARLGLRLRKRSGNHRPRRTLPTYRRHRREPGTDRGRDSATAG